MIIHLYFFFIDNEILLKKKSHSSIKDVYNWGQYNQTHKLHYDDTKQLQI